MASAPELNAPAGWLASRWTRLNGPRRVAGVDLARGLAVIGMIAAHVLWIDDLDIADAATWVAVVEGRSSILFATLAGVSIGLVTGGRTPLEAGAMHTARMRLAVRAGLLWLIGLALIATGVPVYVILPAYAILFLLALPLTGLGAKPLLMIAGGLALVMPVVQVGLDAAPAWSTSAGQIVSPLIGWHYPFPVWIAFVAAGLGVARAGIGRPAVQARLLGCGAALAVLGYGADALNGVGPASGASSFWAALWTAEPHSTGLWEVIGSGGFALAVLGACLLACRTVVTWIVLPLRAVGAMPLTAYVVQLVVWAVVATTVLGSAGDLRGFRDLEPFWPMTLGLVLGCAMWALLVGRGPLEWALDRAARAVGRGAPRDADRLSG